MSENEWFIDWFSSPYYDELYFRRNEIEAATFIKKLLTHLQPIPKSRMLDVGCGKGRHAKLLAERGFNVTGIDLSAPSIEEARKFETDNLHFYRHDMRLPFYINYFNYTFNFFTSFGYFQTEREHLYALGSMVNSLLPGGTLVIDYLNVDYASKHLKENECFRIDGVNYTIERWQTQLHFFKKIEINDQGHRFSFTEKVRKFRLEDFDEMLSDNNIEIKEVFGNYQLETFDIRNSPRLILIARKPAIIS